MDLTAVIPVGRQSAHLLGVLTDLGVQGFTGRVILAWRKPEVEGWLRELLDRLPAPVAGNRIETVRASGGSPPELRNAAADLVRSEWILFLDDDIILSADYVVELRSLIANPPEDRIIQGSAVRCIDHGNWLARREEHLSAARLTRWADGDYLQVCDARNLLIATQVAREFPFDPRLRLGGEGHELAQRLNRRGHRIRYQERLMVLHQHRTRLVSLGRQKFGHGRGRVLLSRATAKPTAFAAHIAGPFSYWWHGRIPFSLLPYAIMTAAMFCAGIIFETIIGRQLSDQDANHDAR